MCKRRDGEGNRKTPQHFQRLGTCLKDVIFNQIQTHLVLIYRFTFFVLFFNAVVVHAQPVNLVPNGGFEERDLCIFNDSYIEDCYPWFNPMDLNYPNWATPDLFHACAVVNDAPCPYPDNLILDPWFVGVPTNTLGCEDPYEGNGYAGGFFFIPNIENQLDGYREYLAVRLTEPMQAGLVYDVSMQVSLAERTTHAIWNFQVLFSPDSLVQATTQYMDYEPQLNGTPGDYIDNKDGWRELSWAYTAEGGEEYMYIGNFQPGSETDTLKLLDWELFYFENSVYYFVDDVRVTNNTLNHSEIRVGQQLNVYPNPVNDFLNIKGDENGWEFTIISIDGRTVAFGQSSEQIMIINCSGMVSGIYLLTITDRLGKQKTQKIIKQ